MSDHAPSKSPADYERIRRVIHHLHEHAHEQPSLAELAEAAGLSPAHLQRVFRRWAGISPKRFLQHLSASDARRRLRASTPILETAFAVGLSGPGRLHDLVVAVDAMTPGEAARFGAGVTIRHGVAESPYGRCFVAVTDRGICALRFVEEGADPSVSLAAEWPGATLAFDPAAARDAVRTVFRDASRPEQLLFVKGTNFQLKVWEALLHVPEGCVVSYGALARRLGRPDATRAVASAVAANPVGYLIPCHRVIRATGALGGYRWGLDRKACMLALESRVDQANRQPAAHDTAASRRKAAVPRCEPDREGRTPCEGALAHASGVAGSGRPPGGS